MREPAMQAWPAAAKMPATAPLTAASTLASPNIVFDDANVDAAVNGAVAGIFAAAGQACIAGSRILVQRSVHDEFVEKLVAMGRNVKMGNPQLHETQLGPIANKPQFEKVLSYFDVGRADGAELA